MKDIEHIIANKSYLELNQDEYTLVQELASNEEEYNQLKGFFANMNELKTNESQVISTNRKANLDKLYTEKHPVYTHSISTQSSPQQSIPLYKQNWMRAASVLLLLSGIAAWFLYNPIQHKDAVSMAKVEQNEQHSKADKTLLESKFAENNTSESTTELLTSEQTAPQQPSNEVTLLAENQPSLDSRAVLNYGRSADLYPLASAPVSALAEDEISTDKISNQELLSLIEASY
jgi:hypothetical protein